MLGHCQLLGFHKYPEIVVYMDLYAMIYPQKITIVMVKMRFEDRVLGATVPFPLAIPLACAEWLWLSASKAFYAPKRQTEAVGGFNGLVQGKIYRKPLIFL